ncbi:MAG: NAD(P)-dependent oxidoreductase [Nitrososphaerales archaeon]
MVEYIPKVGFIGVGAMGAPMAKNIMKAGFPVVAYDIREEALDAIRKAGAEISSSPAELARSAAVVITMLPNPHAIREAMFGKAGALNEICEQHVLIEMSTIDLELTLELAQAVEQRGGAFLDSPVGGTPDMAETRDLELLVSGNKKETYEKLARVLDAMGKRVIFVGKAGNGKILKLAANSIIAINKLAAIEACNVALKNGIDPDVLQEVMRHSTANSTVFERYGRTMLGDETPFTNRHTWHLKDLKLMQELCNSSGTPFYLGSLVHNIIQSSCNENGGIESLGAAIRFYRKAP